ncbi:MAG TPA: hypothetical protein VJC16_06880 [Candidatus Nanoarchaeia archaeon]|nr:hypothetical protein [Candidatus Nanoarchaeia archaeon]
MAKSSGSYILDTSALISLGSVHILEQVLKVFSVTTTGSVIRELEDFAKYGDKYGSIAREVLAWKSKLVIESCETKEPIKYIEPTDNELYSLALQKGLPLVTDETKLVHHARKNIEVYFTTLFLVMLAEARHFTKKEALHKLEELRDIRNWRNNIIYITTRNQLELLSP